MWSVSAISLIKVRQSLVFDGGAKNPRSPLALDDESDLAVGGGCPPVALAEAPVAGSRPGPAPGSGWLDRPMVVIKVVEI